jgi:hypothetical protein
MSPNNLSHIQVILSICCLFGRLDRQLHFFHIDIYVKKVIKSVWPVWPANHTFVSYLFSRDLKKCLR